MCKRRTLALARTRSLPIANNLARIRIYSNNKCQRCDMNTNDDEVHFFLVCPTLSILRTQYLSPILCPNYLACEKLVKLLASDNVSDMMNIYMYVSKALVWSVS